MFARIVWLFAAVLAGGICWSQEKPAEIEASSSLRLHRIAPGSADELKTLLKYNGRPLPVVSGHRGGSAAGYPENCIPTFEHTLAHAFALLEIDPRYAQDGTIVVHHDATLERTTTGRGAVHDFTVQQLKQLRLKDRDGKPTDFAMPTLDEVLKWARGKAVLVLDQKDVSALARLKKIEEHKAEAYALLIVYSFKDAQACHAQNPNVMMEVMIPNLDKVAEFDRTGVPWNNVIAFVGHTPPDDPELYAAIHRRGARCMVGTSRNLDRQVLGAKMADVKVLERDYRELLDRGVDLFETDIPAPLGAMLYAGQLADAAPPLVVK